ncbi:hypothetical protein SAMN05443248_8004 [Bradyrhizobium erythrophlei]|uniref:Uncharacterized protein n=1 Tax=Bradyrhizobium erythrophlei TaxID=1437360 RepID=A0A1M5Y843_9BRAD|nr:hypothetical protein SAMN05443248_8004 [Bradyrhizobium erythrophlei]
MGPCPGLARNDSIICGGNSLIEGKHTGHHDRYDTLVNSFGLNADLINTISKLVAKASGKLPT